VINQGAAARIDNRVLRSEAENKALKKDKANLKRQLKTSEGERAKLLKRREQAGETSSSSTKRAVTTYKRDLLLNGLDVTLWNES
jgi:hypothetical protein